MLLWHIALPLLAIFESSQADAPEGSGTAQENEFIIHIGSLHTIYRRGEHEKCDVSRMNLRSIQVKADETCGLIFCAYYRAC